MKHLPGKGGLMFIKDLFFLHEQALVPLSAADEEFKLISYRRKINLWQSFTLLSPFLGPLLASFMTISLSWRWSFWVYTIEKGLALGAVTCFAEETYYDRRIPADDQFPPRSRWQRLVGVEQWRSRRQRNTWIQAIMRTVKVLLKPVVFLINIYYICIFAWLVAINATLPIFLAKLYGFGPKQTGMCIPVTMDDVGRYYLTANCRFHVLFAYCRGYCSVYVGSLVA